MYPSGFLAVGLNEAVRTPSLLVLSVDSHAQAACLHEAAEGPPSLSSDPTIDLSQSKLRLPNCFVRIPRVASCLVYMGHKVIPKSIDIDLEVNYSDRGCVARVRSGADASNRVGKE